MIRGIIIVNTFNIFLVFTSENSKLINSAKEGNLSEVIDAILKGANVNARDDVSYFHYLDLHLLNKTVSLNGFLEI